MPANRNSSVNIAKGLGIALVVFGHNQIVVQKGSNGLLFDLIFSFHVPLFFFLAGLFVRPADPLAAVLRSKADSLLKPYFVVLLVFGAVLTAARAWRGRASFTGVLDYLQGVLYGVGATISLMPLWFLPCLFLVSVLGFLALRFARSSLAIAAVAVLAWIVSSATLGQAVLPWSADLVPLCLAFFLAGYASRHIIASMSFRPLWFALLVLAFAALNWQSSAAVDLNLRLFEAPVLSTVRAFVGIGLCLQLSCFLTRYQTVAKGLAFVGTGSMFILLFHGLCQGQVSHTAGRLTGHPLIGNLLGFVAGIVVPLLFLALVQRSRPLAALLLPLRKKSAAPTV